MAVVTMKSLLESGVHFGHQTRRWDPGMKKYIFAQRNGIHIIDLQKTIAAIKSSYDAVRKTVLSGKSVLFVGTKKQAQAAIKSEAERCEMFYVNNRWLGGMLTNFSTIKKSLLRLKKIEKMEVDGTFEQLTKKEVASLLHEKGRLEKSLGGIKNMNEQPGILFVIDTKKEAIAVAEARRMNIPIVAVVDTNSNPDGITYPIPGNDDAIRAISLFTQIIANAVVEADNEQGLKVIETLQDEDEAEESMPDKPTYDEDAEATIPVLSEEPDIRESEDGGTYLSDGNETATLADFAFSPRTETVKASEDSNAPLKEESETNPSESSLSNTGDKAKKTMEDESAPETGEPADEPKLKSKKKETIANPESDTGDKKSEEKSKEQKMSISPQDVKKLRDKTGAGMLDCKNALIKAEGDFSAAERVLKEQGLASADKRVGRATNNGSVFTFIGEDRAAMAELTCETDFVAKNDVFRSSGAKIAEAIADAATAEKTDQLETMVKESIAVLKENMQLGRVVFWNRAPNEVLVDYAHNGGVIGVMVKLTCDNEETAAKDEVRTLGFDLALHAAAYNPPFLNKDSIDPAYIKEQEEIFKAQAQGMEDKPEKVISGIVQGKLKKHLSQVCFVDQAFVKEAKKTVKEIVDETAKTLGAKVELTDYAYIAVGQDV